MPDKRGAFDGHSSLRIRIALSTPARESQTDKEKEISVGGGRPVVAILTVVAVLTIITIAVLAVMDHAVLTIAVVIVVPIAPLAIATIDRFKVGSAAAIDPDALAIVPPGAAVDAVGLAASTDDENPIASRGPPLSGNSAARSPNKTPRPSNNCGE